MDSTKKPIALIIGSIFMILLGLARGLGGIVLLLKGKTTLPDIKTNENVIVFFSNWFNSNWYLGNNFSNWNII